MERRQIVAMHREGRGRVLVTLVRAAGSSYRRTGARMLLDDGSPGSGAGPTYAGTISGGCLEAELVRKGMWMVRDGAVLKRYSTAFDSTDEIPFGLGCGGVLDLLAEPAGTLEYDALLAALARSLEGDESVVATWLPQAGRPLLRAVFAPGGELRFRSEGLVAMDLDEVNLEAVVSANPEVFVERIEAPQRMLVLGAGDDAKPMVRMAALLGWSVVVADGRGQLARAERFPEAERVVALRAGEPVERALGIAARDAVVVMTHSYEQDRELLECLLGMAEQPRYLGLLGARHRSSLLVSEVAARLGTTVEACCERLWAPVGLDLGGDGAEAIALAVVAEAHASVEGRLGASRRLSAREVEELVAQGGASRYLQAQCAL